MEPIDSHSSLGVLEKRKEEKEQMVVSMEKGSYDLYDVTGLGCSVVCRWF